MEGTDERDQGASASASAQELDGVSRIERLLASESNATPASEEKPADDAYAAAEEGPEHDPFGGETPEPEEPAEGEENEGQPDKPQHPNYAKEDAKVRLGDGTEVTVAELSKGYLRQSDYTRKTQDLAIERNSINQLRQHYAQADTLIQQSAANVLAVAQQLLPQPPDDALFDTDFVEYTRQQRAYERAQQAMGALNAYAQEAQARQHQEQRQQFETWKQANWQELTRHKPELAKNWDTYTRDALPVLASYGFSPQEFQNQYDYRMHMVVADLMELKRIKESAKGVQQKAKGVPPTMRAGTRASASEQGRSALDSAKARVRKTGSKHDGLAAITKFLSSG